MTRVRCTSCRTIHAILPSFSLPHSSLDVTEVDSYLASRSAGNSRREASFGLGLSAFSYQTWKRLDRRIHERFHQMRTITQSPIPSHLDSYTWFQSTCATTKPVSALNRSFISQYGRGWFCGNLSFLGYRSTTGISISHNMATTRIKVAPIDSS